MSQYKNQSKTRGTDHSMSFADVISDQTVRDARGTAETMFPGSTIKQQRYIRTITPAEFAALCVENHRAELNTPLSAMYTEPGDVKSVEYSMSHKVSPIALLTTSDGDSCLRCQRPSPRYVVIDGAHRVAAAFLTNTPIKCVIFAISDK